MVIKTRWEVKANFAFNFPSTSYDQIAKTRAAMGRAVMISHTMRLDLSVSGPYILTENPQ
jgi:hypothetical protein